MIEVTEGHTVFFEGFVSHKGSLLSIVYA
jgi:hypothetical protein